MREAEEQARDNHPPDRGRDWPCPEPSEHPDEHRQEHEPEEHLLVEPGSAEGDQTGKNPLANADRKRPVAVLQAGDPHQGRGPEAALAGHRREDAHAALPAVMLHVVPGQQPDDREQRQQEILAESQAVEQGPQPDISAVAGRASPQHQHSPLVGRNERQRKDEARERCAGDAPVGVFRRLFGLSGRLVPGKAGRPVGVRSKQILRWKNRLLSRPVVDRHEHTISGPFRQSVAVRAGTHAWNIKK